MSKHPHAKHPTLPPRQPAWRDHPDAAYHGYPSIPSPESLHPGPSVTLRAVCGDEEAQAIVDSYACRLPVITVAAIPEVL